MITRIFGALVVCQAFKIGKKSDEPFDGTYVFETTDDKDTFKVLGHGDVSQTKSTVQDPETMQWTSQHPKAGVPNLVLFFKDDCPPCKGMHEEWIQLAKDVKDSGADVNVMAINRQYNEDAVYKYDIEEYPTIRLYKSAGLSRGPAEMVEFDYDNDSNLTEDAFQKFLSKNGVKTPKELAKEKSDSKVDIDAIVLQLREKLTSNVETSLLQGEVS